MAQYEAMREWVARSPGRRTTVTVAQLEIVPEDLTLVRFALDGNMHRFEMLPLVPSPLASWADGLIAPAPGAAPGEPRRLVSAYEVCDGKEVLWYLPALSQASRRPAPTNTDYPRLLRYYLGLSLSPSEPAHVTLGRFQNLRVDGPVMIGPQQCYRLTQQRPTDTGGSTATSVWVAPDCGMALVRYDGVGRSGGGAGAKGTRATWQGEDFAELVPGVWLPRASMRTVYRYDDDVDDAWWSTTRVTFEELSPEVPPAPGLFQIELPLGTRLAAPAEPSRMWVGDAQRRLAEFEADRIPPPYDPEAARPLTGRELKPPELSLLLPDTRP
jgi:hypothetical protein